MTTGYKKYDKIWLRYEDTKNVIKVSMYKVYHLEMEKKKSDLDTNNVI